MGTFTAGTPGGHRTVWALAAATAVVVLAGCGAGRSSAPGTTTARPDPSSASSAPTASSASPADRATQQALAAYLGMWQDVAAAATTSDWQSPRLAQHATGDALSVLSRAMSADHANGLVTNGTPKNTPQVSSVDPPTASTTVRIADCGDSTNWLTYRADNGQLADTTPGGRRSITAEVKLAQDGAWKVTRFAVEALGSC